MQKTRWRPPWLPVGSMVWVCPRRHQTALVACWQHAVGVRKVAPDSPGCLLAACCGCAQGGTRQPWLPVGSMLWVCARRHQTALVACWQHGVGAGPRAQVDFERQAHGEVARTAQMWTGHHFIDEGACLS